MKRVRNQNQFVWYPVETEDGKSGYISSAYIKKANEILPCYAFTDVEEKYQEAVHFLVSKGIKGKSDGTFGTHENYYSSRRSHFCC